MIEPAEDFSGPSTPSVPQRRGRGQGRTERAWQLRCATLATPIGRLQLACDSDDQLRGVDWEDGQGRLLRLLRRQYRVADIDLMPVRQLPAPARALAAYFDGELKALDRLMVVPAGTPFQRRVWQALRGIPAGTTLTYAALAARIGHPAAVRAVGAANGANPVSVIIPCHRLVGSGRSLTGYAGGIERKAWLLAHEGARH